MWPPNLQLDFSRRPLGDAGARAVAEHLPAGVTQLSLDFTHCGIGEAGARAVAEHLRSCGAFLKGLRAIVANTAACPLKLAPRRSSIFWLLFLQVCAQRPHRIVSPS